MGVAQLRRFVVGRAARLGGDRPACCVDRRRPAKSIRYGAAEGLTDAEPACVKALRKHGGRVALGRSNLVALVRAEITWSDHRTAVR
eukprot:COSAG02_NODE_22777_length_740_cov_4.169249_1_plen_86_part_01